MAITQKVLFWTEAECKVLSELKIVQYFQGTKLWFGSSDLGYRIVDALSWDQPNDKRKREQTYQGTLAWSGNKFGVEKRHLHHTEELFNSHPELLDRTSPSLDAKLRIVATAIPELAAKASAKAISEWGRPATDITHLVVTTNSGEHIPGVDFRLVSLLGLRPTVRRTMLYLNGCAALRPAKDLAENNRGARVLVVCPELTLMLFGAPEEGNFQTLVYQGLFGDGAGTMDPGERPLFEIVSASQTIIPDTEHAINMRLTDRGLVGSIATREVPVIIGDSIERCLEDSFGRLGVGAGWNDLFWAVHPGSTAILDHVEAALRLEPGKLAASRRVLSDHGNMFGVTVIFVLDELRRRRREKEGEEKPAEWGVRARPHLGDDGVARTLKLTYRDRRERE